MTREWGQAEKGRGNVEGWMEVFSHEHQTHEKKGPGMRATTGFPAITVIHKWKCPILCFESWLPFKGPCMVNELRFCARKFLRNYDAQQNGAKTHVKEWQKGQH